jgi:hypothetical protein
MSVNGPPVFGDASPKCEKECHFGRVNRASTTDGNHAVCIQRLKKRCGSKDIGFAWVFMDVRENTTRYIRNNAVNRFFDVSGGHQVLVYEEPNLGMASCDGEKRLKEFSIRICDRSDSVQRRPVERKLIG